MGWHLLWWERDSIEHCEIEMHIPMARAHDGGKSHDVHPRHTVQTQCTLFGADLGCRPCGAMRMAGMGGCAWGLKATWAEI